MVMICEPQTLTVHMQYYPLIMLQVRACKSGGIDTRVHGVNIIGRVDMNEDEVAANFSFLTVEDIRSRDPGFVRQQRRKEHVGGVDAHSNKVSSCSCSYMCT